MMKERSEVQPDVFVIGMCRVVAGPAKRTALFVVAWALLFTRLLLALW